MITHKHFRYLLKAMALCFAYMAVFYSLALVEVATGTTVPQYETAGIPGLAIMVISFILITNLCAKESHINHD